MKIGFSKEFEKEEIYSSFIRYIKDGNIQKIERNILKGQYSSACIFLEKENHEYEDCYLKYIKNDPFIYALFNQKFEFLGTVIKNDDFPINPYQRIKVEKIFDKETSKSIRDYFESNFENTSSNEDLTLIDLLHVLNDLNMINEELFIGYYDKIKNKEKNFLEISKIIKKDLFCYKYTPNSEDDETIISDFFPSIEGLAHDLILRTRFRALEKDFDFNQITANDKHDLLILNFHFNSYNIYKSGLHPIDPKFLDYNIEYHNSLVEDTPPEDTNRFLKDAISYFIERNREELIEFYGADDMLKIKI